MSRMNTCNICGKNFETEGNHKHRYCPECQAKYKSPKDYAYYLKQKKNKGQDYLDQRNEYFKKWQKDHPTRTKEINQKTQQKRRFEILSIYSNNSTPVCAICGEKTLEFLALDHIDNSGGKHRKSLKRNTIYDWIIKNNFPKIFQVLCHNCNWKKSRFGRIQKECYECGKLEFNKYSTDCLYCKKTRLPVYLNCKKLSQKFKIIKYAREYLRKLKIDVVNHYSNGLNRCNCCGLNDLDILAIDHIEGKGNVQRKANKLFGGVAVYKWLINNNYPDGYQVLCYNCNMAKGFYGVCPHNK